MNTAEKVLASAKGAAVSAETWADLSNALFDPVDGLVAKAYPTRDEREQFVKTSEYRAIRELIDSATQRTGLVEGATPKKSGRFVVRLPNTLHAALEAEAEDEGVSLNQLVVTKLAVQMTRLAAGSVPDMDASPRHTWRSVRAIRLTGWWPIPYSTASSCGAAGNLGWAGPISS